MLEVIIDTFNNREIAFFIYVIIALFMYLSRKKTRKSILVFVDKLFKWRIFLLLLMMFVYIGIMILLFIKLNLWDNSLLKDTAFWSFGVAFIILLNSIDASDNEDYFRKSFFDNIGLVLILEFVSNLYVFNFFVEILTLPVIIFLTKTRPHVSDDGIKIKRVIDFILFFYGIIVLVYSIYHIIIDIDSFISIGNLKLFLLIPIFTLLYIPFVYSTALYMEYELMRKNIKLKFRDNAELIKYYNWRIFFECNFSLRDVTIINKNIEGVFVNEKTELRNVLSTIISKEKHPL